MKPTQRAALSWRRSALAACGPYLLAASLAVLVVFVANRLVVVVSQRTLMLSGLLTLGCFALMAFVDAARQPRTRRIILAADRRIWIGVPAQSTFDEAAELPELRAFRTYSGLIWLANTAGQTCLVMPGSLSADDARQLQIWVRSLPK